MQNQYNIPLKCCTICGNEFPATLEHFYKTGGKKEGLRPTCKRCTIEQAKRTRDPEKLREYHKKWSQENREKRRQSCRDWRSRNIDEQREREKRVKRNDPNRVAKVRAWEAKNFERNLKNRREGRKKYAKENGGKLRAAWHRYESRKRGLPDDFTESDWQFALDHFYGRCAVCGRPPGFFHKLALDHWIPISDPDCPGTVPHNIVPLCHGVGGCNNRKRHTKPQEWLKQNYGAKEARAISNRVHGFFSLVRKTN